MTILMGIKMLAFRKSQHSLKHFSTIYTVKSSGFDSTLQSLDNLKLHSKTVDSGTFHKLCSNFSNTQEFIDFISKLHLAALTSLKEEIIDVSNRLQHVTGEKNMLEKQINKAQTDKLRIQRDYEDKVEKITSRYEERITELHSVIAELRKKIDRHNINIIREEDEYEDQSDAGQSAKSNDDLGSVNDVISLNENNANESLAASIAADIGPEINADYTHGLVHGLPSLSRKNLTAVTRLAAAADTGTSSDGDTGGGDGGGVGTGMVKAINRRDADRENDNDGEDDDNDDGDVEGDDDDHDDDDDDDVMVVDKRNVKMTKSRSMAPHMDSFEDNVMQICKKVKEFSFDSAKNMSRKLKPTFHPPPPPPSNDLPPTSDLQDELNNVRQHNNTLTEQVGRQEVELNTMKVHMCTMRDDRDRFKKKVRELQSQLQYFESSVHSDSRTSTPIKSPVISPTAGKRALATNEQFPVAKIAELKKLKTCANDKQQLPNAKVAEHLVQSLQECSSMQEIVQTVYKCGNEISESKIREFEIEFERLNSKIDHWKSQYGLLALNLEESKTLTDRLSVLIGKYESNNTALQLAINYSDQAIEACEVLCAVMESEHGFNLANFHASGLSGFAGEPASEKEQQHAAHLLQKAYQARQTAVSMAKQLLQKLDRSCGINTPQNCSPRPWDDMSTSHTVSTTTGSDGSAAAAAVVCDEVDFSKSDELRLREYIQQLKNDRASVKMTVMELESVHVDRASDSGPAPSIDTQSLDLENAVLMQELMAMKEEKAELKSQNYLLEKEKKALDLRMSDKESQGQAYRLQIDHLNNEIKELQHQLKERHSSKHAQDVDNADSGNVSIDGHANEISEAQRREKKLKGRIQELMITLEKLSRNSEIRQQQSTEFVNDLKRANCALISAFEKAKKKYQSRLKKMETQMQEMKKQYEKQLRQNENRPALPDDKTHAAASTNETSL
ncbi:colorectal mutant cancer protein isoform X3 [Octopus sinensis]|uniref:Colorectal mutant cancer protein isoform X3 n=1 Tax=Octopus sinensis TaxID=2607531 RepID=A0A7E6FV62_9MOLL|nr:colorectal mutant cancer protein isoform X3 [Octopus sinensis]